MSKTLAVIMLLSVSVVNSALAVTTLTFSNNSSPVSTFPSDRFNSAFTSGNEYRSINPPLGGASGGGEMDVIFGGEQWIFNEGGQAGLTSVLGTPNTPVATNPSLYPGGSAPGGDTALHQNFDYFGQPLGFLAPVLGSVAGNRYGAATLITDFNNNTLEVLFPVLEGQWGGLAEGPWFPLGLGDQNNDGQSDGIIFNGKLSNIVRVGETVTFDFALFGEHVGDDGGLDPANNPEDPFLTAIVPDFTFQWELHGSGVYVVPVPAAIWLFGSGLLCLVSVVRKRS